MSDAYIIIYNLKKELKTIKQQLYRIFIARG